MDVTGSDPVFYMVVRAYTADGIPRREDTVYPSTGVNGNGLLIETQGHGEIQDDGDSDWVFWPQGTDDPLMRVLTIEFIDGIKRDKAQPDSVIRRFTYSTCNTDDARNGLGFYCSRNLSNSGLSLPTDDVEFEYDVAQGRLLVRPEQMPMPPGQSIDDYFPGEEDAWILPYGNRVVCDAISAGAGCYRKDLFISPITGDPSTGSFVTPLARDWTFPDHDVVVDDEAVGINSYNWTDNAPNVFFQPGRYLIVEGEMDITDMALSTANTSAGWGGIRFASGSKGTLTDAAVSGVVVPPGTGLTTNVDGAALTATDATVTLSGTTISGTDGGHGILAMSGASVTIADLSLITQNDLYGAKATSNASIALDTDAEVVGNLGGGLYANGGSVLARDGEVDLNIGIGLASRTGTAELIRSAPSGGSGSRGGDPDRVFITDNQGGLSATHSASVSSLEPVCAQPPCSFNAHTITRNAVGGFFDARALQSSSVQSQGNFWGPGVDEQSDLVVVDDGTSIVQIAPDPGASGLRGSSGTTAGKGGDGSSLRGAFRLVAEAEAASLRGDTETAHTALAAALVAAFTDAEEAAAYAAAGRIVGRDRSPAVEAWLQGRTDGHAAPLALAALGMAYERTGRAADARASFETLARTDDDANAALVRLAAADGREADALAAFGALLASEADDETLGNAAALLLGVFPDADLSAARTAPPRVATTGGNAETASTLVAAPNPAAGRTTVRFTLDRPAAARLTVVDMLGREVAVLTDGPLGEGPHTVALDTADLAPGAYLLRLDGENGAEATRLTVAR